MEKLLSKMDPERKKRLINAALIEFGKNTYDKASTNVIVKEAGISKGLLYHYFKNKEELYNYLIDFLFKKLVGDIIDHVDFDKGDILERSAKTAEYKMKIFAEYPGIYLFSKRFYAGKSASEMVEMIDKHSPGNYKTFFQKNVDYSLFRDDIDVSKAMRITQWTFEKYVEDYGKLVFENQPMEVEKVYEEFYAYLDVLRKAFYKQA